MVLLIISPNLIRILLGWDGLGLISYCLVIYYQRDKSYNAGILTIMRNRVGDIIIMIRIGWVSNFGRWNFFMYDGFNTNIYSIISIFIIIASLTKRAQLPFSSWLPAAIAAPTPVSSLVHSSTLVTAGIYLLIRFHFIFENKVLIFMVIIISGLTIFISGLVASFEFDLKKGDCFVYFETIRFNNLLFESGNVEIFIFFIY